MKKVEFIAEISSNHSGNLDRCYDFIDKAKEIGCDVVKFQLFRIDQLFSSEALNYNKELIKRKSWELPIEFLSPLHEHCLKRDIKFSCTPFYLDAIKELEPFVSFFKIASYELLWDDLLKGCAKTGKPIVLSTGMASLEEIMRAVKVLKSNGCKDLTLLHCTSVYPSPIEECNLSAIDTLRKATKLRVGWSDHTVNPAVINRAIHKWGSEVIEFHLDLEGKGEEFASGHCWLPENIDEVISQTKSSMLVDGNGVKETSDPEKTERDWRADPSDGLRPLLETREKLREDI